MGDKHGPNRFDRYQEIHETVMERLRKEGFILSDNLEFRVLGNGLIELEGLIECLGGIRVEVDKLIEVISGDGPDALVQTARYSYNASLAGRGNILRYDNPHKDRGGDSPDHHKDHHVHRYDVFVGDRSGTVAVHGPDGWPTLGEVLCELRDWYYANIDRLEQA